MPALRAPPPPATATLREQIDRLHSLIETYVDEIVEVESRSAPGVPKIRLKHDLLVRAGFCSCAFVAQHPEKAS